MNNLRGLLLRLFALVSPQCTRKCSQEGPELAYGVGQVTLAHDTVAIEDRPCLVSRERYRHALGDAGPNQISDGHPPGTLTPWFGVL